MDKNAAMTIEDLNKKIESLQAKREAVIKKEKDRKAKAQEKWKNQFVKEAIKGIISIYGVDYEESLKPEIVAQQAISNLRNEDLVQKTENMDKPLESKKI